MDWWKYSWRCPFYLWSDRLEVHCEGKCRIGFGDGQEAREYLREYCAGEWERCTVARSKLQYYERQE
ncbi:MAG: hypothetical protein LUF80_00560 [Oscillospiraceae bacterium]|nr:hypothetical protein [Oscillospiraceae bacterium]